jgi:AcrR family transcriptional regulator
MYLNTDTYMKEKRLTRRQSQELTRSKLVESAEKVFIQRGFDGASVEQIAEAAGFSRGAFYSNFEDKDAIFLEVLDKRRRDTRSALDAIFREKHDMGQRFRAARDWYADQWKQRHWTILKTEFHLRALRNRAVRKRLSEIVNQELDDFTVLLTQYYEEARMARAGDPRTVTLSLFALSHALGILSLLDASPESERSIIAARSLAFDRLISAPKEGSDL